MTTLRIVPDKLSDGSVVFDLRIHDGENEVVIPLPSANESKAYDIADEFARLFDKHGLFITYP